MGYIALTALAGLCILYEQHVLILTLLTAGLWILLPTFWVYATALLPAYLLKRTGAQPIFYIPLGFTCVASLALVPFYLARADAEKLIGELTREDFETSLPAQPMAIELVRHPKSTGDSNSGASDADCGYLCQRILVDETIPSVTITVLQPESRVPLVVTYRLRKPEECPKAAGSSRDKALRVIKLNRQGQCIVPELGVGMTAGLSVEEDTIESTSTPSSDRAMLRGVRRLIFRQKSDGVKKTLMRKTEVRVGVTSMPFSITPIGGYDTPVLGWTAARREISANRYRLFPSQADRLRLVGPADDPSAALSHHGAHWAIEWLDRSRTR
jgi:hypothetical protein